MRKYTSRATKLLAVFAIISVIMLVIGLILIVSNSSNLELKLVITIFGGLMSIIFLSCFFAEKSRWLAINDNEIVLPRGADNNGKMVFKRTIIKVDEITSVESNLYKGDGLISKDTLFHTLKLKDGTKVTFTLCSYGKTTEKEILETIKKII